MAREHGINSGNGVRFELYQVSSPYREAGPRIANAFLCSEGTSGSSIRVQHLPTGRFQVRALLGEHDVLPDVRAEIEVRAGETSFLRMVLQSGPSELATLRGEFLLADAQAPGAGAMRGQLVPWPVSDLDKRHVIRLERAAEPFAGPTHEFTVRDLVPGDYRISFRELGWNEVVHLTAGQTETIRAEYAGRAEVQLLLLDSEDGSHIEHSAVSFDGSLIHTRVLRVEGDGEGRDPASEEATASTFSAPAGKGQMFIEALGYEPLEVRVQLVPGLNALSFSLNRSYPVWLRFDEPLPPELQHWALAVEVWREDVQGVAARILPWEFRGGDLVGVCVQLPGEGRYVLSWPRAGTALGPLLLDVEMPFDRRRELVVTPRTLGEF